VKTLLNEVQDDQPEAVICAVESPRNWYVPRLARCYCSTCGAHAYRRMAPDGQTPREPRRCTVCGKGQLMLLEL
jgi:hypothetical protein